MPSLLWPTTAEAESVSARQWQRAFHALDEEHQALRLAYWDERTERTAAEAEAIIEDNVNRECLLLWNSTE